MKRIRPSKLPNFSNTPSLQTIPEVGPSIATDLEALGIKKISHLRGKSPERLYTQRCRQVGAPIDRCLLYVFRCAVYYASYAHHQFRLLHWWHWSDDHLKAARRATDNS